jgi:hypothetical protein
MVLVELQAIYHNKLYKFAKIFKLADGFNFTWVP